MGKRVTMLLVVILTVACARLSRGQSFTADDAHSSERRACASVCLTRLQSCTEAGADAGCAAENAQCVHSCERTQSGRIYAFYCQAEIVTHRGLVLRDSSCTGAVGETLDAQRSGCERGFEPPPDAPAYTVACRPVLTWVDSAARGRPSRPTHDGARVPPR
jgi:hypothetical protein